ncbi:acetoin utilization protein AcuC [Desulfuromonas sp. AOP6]|uniref:acetoin utilization protein AcuC n=1 Tax=Desulfuromonas sp. AOP6 TaxID=1566351 RepID=UPI0012791E05|nr:acetoin utilization protein AcuC [Desulfuromonas sp. AOP6]BCA79722.1 acetoin utilization protein AcuC [Desulfuromonas sp. AOP6]
MGDHFAFVYSSRFADYSFGDDHPFKVQRYQLTYELIRQLGLLASDTIKIIEAPLVDEEALLSFHRADYLKTLKEFSRETTPRANFFFNLGDVENPVFPGLYDWARLGCGGTVEAARQVVRDGCRVAFNMAGGYHHAHAARASGFSYLNDAVIAINDMVGQGLRVAYVDIDAHHGDGVQEAFYHTDRVLTISLHESGEDFFPHTGFPWEMGEGKGFGYSVNIPFRAHSDDLIFEQAFRRIVLPLLDCYAPDVLVTQLGVDSLRTDPLTRLEMTTGSIELAARSFLGTGIPWVAIGGGGYDKFNVCRGWALAWAIMTGKTVGDDLPAEFRKIIRDMGMKGERLRDMPHLALPDDFSRAEQTLGKVLRTLESRLFPLFGL